jgi:hypothetical protein
VIESARSWTYRNSLNLVLLVVATVLVIRLVSSGSPTQMMSDASHERRVRVDGRIDRALGVKLP